MNEVRYPALNTMVLYFRILGSVAIIITLVVMAAGVIQVFVEQVYLGVGMWGFLGALLGATWGSLVVLAIYGLIGTVIAVLHFATAEALVVLTDIESNTRK